MTDDLRKLADAVIGAPEMKSYVWPTASNEITVWLGEEEAAFIAAASPSVVLGLLDRIAELEASNLACVKKVAEWATKAGALRAGVDNLTQYAEAIERKLRFAGQERDEARAAVKRLAGALEKAINGLALYAEKQDGPDLRDALADPIVRRIVGV